MSLEIKDLIVRSGLRYDILFKPHPSSLTTRHVAMLCRAWEHPTFDLSFPPNHLHNNHETQRVGFDPSYLKSWISGREDALPLIHGAFSGVEERHHAYIRGRAHGLDRSWKRYHIFRLAILAPFLFADVVDEQHFGAWSHCWHQSSKNFDGLGLGPVVQNELQEIDIGLERLWVKEGVFLELDAAFELIGHVGFECWLDLAEILYSNVEVREVLRQDDSVVTARAADLGLLASGPT